MPSATSQESDVVGEARKFLDAVGELHEPEEVRLRRSLEESWFSNMLSWLLDPKGSHGLGDDFLDEFVKRVAKKRSAGDAEYDRYDYFLKYGKAGRGTGTASFNLGNAATFREFYLSPTVHTDYLSNRRYVDVVAADLDSGEGLFLAIENKLFSANRPRQLYEYFHGVREQYGERVGCTEFVYLTLDERPAVVHDDVPDSDIDEKWVSMSWAGDVFPILESVAETGAGEVEQLIDSLGWMRKLLHPERAGGKVTKDHVEALHDEILQAVGECLFEELVRLHDDDSGSGWEFEATSGSSVNIKHSRYPARTLHVEMLPNFSITLQSRGDSDSDPYMSKILVPFGAPTSQVFNLLDIAARDAYYKHLDRPSDFLSGKRRLRETQTEKKKEHKRLFDFIHERRFELKVLMTISSRVWDSARRAAAEGADEVEGK